MKIVPILRTFLPWVGVKVLYVFFPTYAMVGGVFLSLILYPKRLQKGFVLEWATFVFFAMGALLTLFWNNLGFSEYMSQILLGFFIVISFGSLLIHKPFTMQYAKEGIDSAYWKSVLFLKTNQIMTALFGVIFSTIFIIDVFRYRHPGIVNGYLVWACALTLKIMLVRKFPAWYRTRYLRSRLHAAGLTQEVYSMSDPTIQALLQKK